MTSVLTPRKMRLSDVDDVHAIEVLANRFPWRRNHFKDSLDAHHGAWVYCDTAQTIIAYAIVQQVLDESHLLNICVHPEWQGRGYGHEVMQHVIEQAQARQSQLMVLEVRATNKRAQYLYEQHGFNAMTIRKNYYPAEQGRDDAVLMGLDLSLLILFDA